MGTAPLYYGFGGQVLTADGALPRAVLARDECCPDPLCIPLCDTLCSFIDLLPSGPMWDFQKIEARQIIGASPNCEGPYDSECATMAWYGVYGGTVLNEMVQTILWPTIRESSPATAVTTLPDWLDRFGWQDCYRQNCRAVLLSELSPFEFEGDCGPEYCAPTFSDEFNCALQHAILQSLVRAQRGIIKTLDGLNWVIEPLGAVLSPRQPYPEEYVNYVQGTCDADEEPCFCGEAQLTLSVASLTLPGCPALDSNCGGVNPPVDAGQPYECPPELPPIIVYPALLAAECIVRSILTKKCPNIVFRTEPVITLP